MEKLSEICAPGSHISDQMIDINEQVTLRVISIHPAIKTDNPPIFFVAGWISLISGWKHVLHEMTKDFIVHYIETREKISAIINGKVDYGVEVIGEDIVEIISKFKMPDKGYIIFGSSLGATSILDCCRYLKSQPLCLVLIGPNAVFRVPKFGMAIIRIFQPRLYLIIKPIVKWYLKTFRLDIKSDFQQYEKYCNSLDAADPWKLKKAVLKLSNYEVWNLLDKIDIPTLIVGGAKDLLHEPANLQKMVSMMKNADYIDLETNARTHSTDVVHEIRKYLSKIRTM